MSERRREAIPPDYDPDPERFRTAREVLRRHGLASGGSDPLPPAAPAQALDEAHRVLRAGGLVAVAAPSRHDSPELAHLLPSGPLTFDAELAPELLSERFGEIEVETWDAQLLELPTEEAVDEYLVGKGVLAERAKTGAASVKPPLRVTKRGALAFARKG